MTYFPAQPGTWLIHHDEDVEPIPVIGWAVSGVVATPILPMPANPVTGQAIRLPGNGAVVDPVWSRTFESEESWRATLGREMPYDLDEPLAGAPAPQSAPAAAPAAKPAARSSSKAATPENVEMVRQLSFGKKTYKNKSFWHVSGDIEFVFELPGETKCPEGENVDKINRDQFFELRKDLPSFRLDPDLLDAASEAEEEDDDDDFDMV